MSKYRKGGENSTKEKDIKTKKIQSAFRKYQTKKNIKESAAKRIQSIFNKKTATKKERDLLKEKKSYKTKRRQDIILTESLKNTMTKPAITYKKTLPSLNYTNVTLNEPKFSSKKPFENVNFRGADFSGPNCRFVGTKIKESNFAETNLSKCSFKRSEVIKSNFNYANLTEVNVSGTKKKNTDFSNSSFKNALFVDIIFNKFINLDNTNIDGATFSGFNFLKLFPQEILNDIKIIKIRKQEIEEEESLYIFENKIFNRLKLKDLLNVGISFNNVVFNNSYIENMTLKLTGLEYNFFPHNKQLMFSKCKFNKSKIINSKLEYCIFNSTEFDKCILTKNNFNVSIITGCITSNECDFSSSSFNGAKLSNTSFEGSKLNACQFIPLLFSDGHEERTNFSEETIFTNCDLTYTTFQECEGLININFEGVKLDGASFSHLQLKDCNFKNASLNGIIFTAIEFDNCDFTNANRADRQIIFHPTCTGLETCSGLTNRELGYKDNKELLVYPEDVHQGFQVLEKNKLYNLILGYLPIEIRNKQSNIDDMINMSDFGEKLILSLKEIYMDKNKIIDKKYSENIKMLDECYDKRLKQFDYNKKIRDTEPPITWGKFLFFIFEYVKQQSEDYQKSYFVETIVESYTTYGDGGISCQIGIIERLIVKLRATIITILPIIKDNEKIIEYNKLLNVIDPTQKLPETIYELKNYISPEYINVDVTAEMRDEWFRLHNSESDKPFDKTTNSAEVINNYAEFLQEKLNYNKLTKNNKLIWYKKISNELVNMAVILFENNGINDMFGGGKYKGKFNIFKLNKKQFNKLWKKMNNKKVINTKSK